MEHIKLINSSGGVLNGSTHYDVTNYYEAVPSNALERVLWLEADRMRALKVDDENLRNQRDVVKEEVRVNVMNQPYGGFPWLDLPPVAFRNWANAHNFYGDFADLDAADLADVQAFFKTYYVPNNAVLLILGDVKPAKVSRWPSNISPIFPLGRRRRSRILASRNKKKSAAATWKKNSAHCRPWPSGTRCPRAAHRLVRHGACSIRRCTAGALAASIASWCSKSRSPSKPMAASTTSSVTTARRRWSRACCTSRNTPAKRRSPRSMK